MPEIKCPKCGEIKQVEVVRQSKDKIEIYCNTCGKSSVIERK